MPGFRRFAQDAARLGFDARTILRTAVGDAFSESDHPREGGKFAAKQASEAAHKATSSASSAMTTKAHWAAERAHKTAASMHQKLGNTASHYEHKTAAGAHNSAGFAIRRNDQEGARGDAKIAENHVERSKRAIQREMPD